MSGFVPYGLIALLRVRKYDFRLFSFMNLFRNWNFQRVNEIFLLFFGYARIILWTRITPPSSQHLRRAWCIRASSMTVILSTPLDRSVVINTYLWDVVNSSLFSYHSPTTIPATPTHAPRSNKHAYNHFVKSC